jgi:hypothetical protein
VNRINWDYAQLLFVHCELVAKVSDLWITIPSGETDNEETAADLSNEADTPR